MQKLKKNFESAFYYYEKSAKKLEQQNGEKMEVKVVRVEPRKPIIEIKGESVDVAADKIPQVEMKVESDVLVEMEEVTS